MSATGRTTTYYYDFTDRTMKYVESGTDYSHSVGYEYDVKNNLTDQTESINGVSKTTSYTYDEDNRLETVTDGTSTRIYTYDAFGRLTQRVTKQGETTILTETFTYHGWGDATTGQISSHRIQTDSYDVTYGYGYDRNGNIQWIWDDTKSFEFYYDGNNQLTLEVYEFSDYVQINGNTYDNGGNLQSVYTEFYGGDNPGETVNYIYGNADWGDLLTGRQTCDADGNLTGTQNYTSDTIGNVTNDGTWEYTWQHGRQLATMSAGSTTWTYTYDADGMRTKRTNGTQTYTYVYNGGQLSQMTRGTDTLRFSYDASGLPLTVTYNGTTYYYITNIQGDVIGIANQSGQMVVQYLYNAWGVHLQTTGTMAATLGVLNPLRYRGYVYDTETELYYLQSRYYDPELCRFINADGFVSTGQGLLGNNMFAYCGNNPVSRIDSCGHFWNTIIGTVAGAIVGGISAVILQTDVMAGIASGALSGAISGAAIDIAIATGGVGLIALAGVAAASGVGGAASSYLNQRMNGTTHDDVDWETVTIDGIWGAIGGMLSFGVADVGGKMSRALAENLALRGKQLLMQAVSDFVATATIAAGTWLNGTKMALLKNGRTHITTEMY